MKPNPLLSASAMAVVATCSKSPLRLNPGCVAASIPSPTMVGCLPQCIRTGHAEYDATIPPSSTAMAIDDFPCGLFSYNHFQCDRGSACQPSKTICRSEISP